LGIQHIISFMLRKLVYFPTKKVHYKSFLMFQQKIRRVRFKQWAKLLVAPSFKLKGVYRRLPQVWQWRRNRKVEKPWRSIRFINKYRLAPSLIYRRTNFRLQRNLVQYLSWKYGVTSSTLPKINSFGCQQAKYQNLSFLLHRNIENNIGSILRNLKVIRNQTQVNSLIKQKGIKVNGHLITAPTLDYKDSLEVVSNRKISTPFNNLAVETSQLIQLYTSLKPINIFTYKYQPKFQRSVDFISFTHKR
jgi:hypothetical protein